MKISDWMDSVRDDTVVLETNTPLSSQRIKELTKMKMENKRVKKRPAVRVLLAAAVIAALTMTAFAAEQVFGIGELFQSLFGNELSQEQITVIDEMGRAFEEGVTSNGTTITPVAAFGDESSFYLRLRVEAPEGVVLADDIIYQPGGMEADKAMTLEFPTSNYKSAGYESGMEALPDDDPTDNVKEFVIRFTGFTGNDMKFNDGEPKILTLHGLWQQIANGEYIPILTGEFQFDIGTHNEYTYRTLDVAGLSCENAEHGYIVTLKEMKITPLNIQYAYTYTKPNNDQVIPDADIEVILTDGSSAALRPGSGAVSDDSAERYLRFEEPVALEQIDYIRFGEHRIEMVLE